MVPYEVNKHLGSARISNKWHVHSIYPYNCFIGTLKPPTKTGTWSYVADNNKDSYRKLCSWHHFYGFSHSKRPRKLAWKSWTEPSLISSSSLALIQVPNPPILLFSINAPNPEDPCLCHWSMFFFFRTYHFFEAYQVKSKVFAREEVKHPIIYEASHFLPMQK